MSFKQYEQSLYQRVKTPLIFAILLRLSMSGDKKDYDFMFKLILVGSSGVGKSNILLRYTKNEFLEGWQMTIGVEYATKTITTVNGTRIKFQIWDTAGQEKYRALMKTFYKGSSAAIIVYDITKEQTFASLDYELKVIKDFTKTDIITMIVGNKVDLEQKRLVSKQRGLDYAESKKLAFYEVSAKEGTNVDLIFTRIAEELEKAVREPESSEQPKLGSNEPKEQPTKKVEPVKKEQPLVLDKKGEDDRKKQALEKKKGCC